MMEQDFDPSEADDSTINDEEGERNSDAVTLDDAFDQDDDLTAEEIEAGVARVGGVLVPKEELEGLSAAQMLEKWRSHLLPTEADLVSELGGSSLFFVSAEAIMFDLLRTKAVAFEEETQFLCLTHGIEQLLGSLRDCGCTFRLIFFDEMKRIFSAAFSEAVWAFRQAFLVHCQSWGIDHQVFPHWYSPEWKEHLAQWRPSFFLLADDSVELELDEDMDEAEVEEKTKLKGFFPSLILRCLSYRTHVALLHGLQRRGNHVNCFALEPDLYDAYIDHNVGASLREMFAEAEDEGVGEDEDECIGASFDEFVKRNEDIVDSKAMLRRFLSTRFASQTFEMCKGQNAQTCQLSDLVVKALFLQETLITQIPLARRAFSTLAAGDWQLFSEVIIDGALEKYFSGLQTDLAKLYKLQKPEGVKLDACDLFDGRMYRHVFQSIVSQGIKTEGKVESDFFRLKGPLPAELDKLWKGAGASNEFFPIQMAALLDFPGFQPPPLPERLQARPKPELVRVRSELMDVLLKDVNFEVIKEVEDHADTALKPQPNVLWDRYDWKDGGKIDSLLQEETMEMNEGEKRMAEKLKLKGKITARDLQFQREWQLKKKQLALKSLAGYARSLTGSDKLHHPIVSTAVSKEKKDADKEEVEKKDAKLSKKHQELLDKKKAEEDEKIKAHDDKQLKSWEPNIEALAGILECEKLEKELLDLMLGFSRVTDSFVGFPALSTAFKTKDAQAKVVVKATKAIRVALKKMQLDKLPPQKQPQALRIVRYVFYMLQEGFSSFAREYFDGKSIKLFQETLISIGFPGVAAQIFEQWKGFQQKVGEAEATPTAEKDAKKGGKDDKKKEKDKKDDKKKFAQKGGKEDKDDAKAAKDLESYRVSKDVEIVWSGVGPDEAAFQLMHMGPYMTRTVGNARDPKSRVNFKPDEWQRELLDIVDDQRSALVVAPTASGKTFIGYYVMDKVLRESDDGVAVYLAPSKALVNQVSAEIYARFSSKTYPPHSKNELLGVFLREFNSAGGVTEQGKWRNCQVLVTIPHILEMLLLSPKNQDWVSRLKWVVFDEVHCIGEQEGGSQWEHSMQLIPCPFIALSATVADPSFFHTWLKKVNKVKKKKDVSLIVHTERWNDLYKFIFTNSVLRPLHPFCCLVESTVRANGLVADLSLAPQEMVQLFQEVKRLAPKWPQWSEALAPKSFFGGQFGFVSKADARRYEKALKEEFLNMLKVGALTSDDFQTLVLALQKPEVFILEGTPAASASSKFTPPVRKTLTEGTPKAEADASGAAEEAPADEVSDMTKLTKSTGYLQPSTLLSICRKLDEANALPGIIFNFSRKENDRMLAKLTQELKDKQWQKYYGTEEASYKSKQIMAKRMAVYKQKMDAYKEAQKMKASKNQEAAAARKTDDGEGGRGSAKGEAIDCHEDATMLEPEKPIELVDEIDIEFTFHSPKALGQWQEDIEQTFKELKYRGTADHLMDALRRGIGMHHEGCRKDYRQAVEVLFRRGYLRVVFATGTLALGINMPCRSTVFCGDSLELNGLMFRQMSGRAGRRGFDLMGQVVFLDMAFPKVQRLIASDLSSLTGEFQLSPSSLLRAMLMWETLIDQESTLKAEGKLLPRELSEISQCLTPMFSLPFFRATQAGGDGALRTQVAYHTRFSAELLQREGLLERDGTTRNFANLVTHLFEVEPANLVLGRLLASGTLHQFLLSCKTKERKNERRTHMTVKLTAVLGWLLYRRRLPRLVAEPRKRKKHLPSEKCPALPPLPTKIRAEVQKFNKSVFDLFEQLAVAVASTRKLDEEDLQLPLTAARFLGTSEATELFAENSPFAEMYGSQILKFRTRSPFVALSGKGDYFASPGDLMGSRRRFYQMDLNSLPLVAPDGSEADQLETSNSWILDFMIHGKIRYLAEDNGVSSTQAWNLIKSFSEIVNMATVALKAFSPANDIVLTTFAALGEEMKKLLKMEGAK